MLGRRRVGSLSSIHERSFPVPHIQLPTLSTSSQLSTYRSAYGEVQIYSASVKDSGDAELPTVPVFGDGDVVSGRVFIDPSCSQNTRVSISIEGAFLYDEPTVDDSENYSVPNKKKHIFFSATTSVPTIIEPVARSPIREALSSPFQQPLLKKKPSTPNLLPSQQTFNAERCIPFSFDLPRSARSREEMPPTFNSGKGGGTDGSRTSFAVEYKIFVVWDVPEAPMPLTVPIPIVFHPDIDFQSLDGLSTEQESWLEMPLRADRPVMPYKCAVTLPTCVTFSRASSIPYFVVFTTTPRSASVAREIAADATISVSILRQVTLISPITLPPSPPQTPSSSNSGEESDTARPKSIFAVRRRLRKGSRAGPTFDRSSRYEDIAEGVQNKPLPRLPALTTFSHSANIHTAMCIGFPKRPRQQCEGHPSLDLQASLPDGLHKSKILLSRDMLPSIDWAGVSVKYYLDVSVVIGQDDLRARIPIRIV